MAPDNTSESGGSLGARVAKTGVIVAVAHMLFKLAGLLLAIVMGRYVAKDTFECVYLVAFEGWLYTVFLTGEKVIGPTFLPVFMSERDSKEEQAAWAFPNAVLTIQFFVLVAVSTLIMLAPGAAIRLVTSWDEAKNIANFELARDSLRAMAPALICLSIGSTTYMLLNGYKRFFLAALGDASWKLCVLITVVVGMGILGLDYRMIVLGLIIGSAAKVATHLLGLRDKLKLLRPSFNWRSKALRRMLILMLPLLCGIVFARFRDIFNSIWILSHLEEGLMRASYFGRKIYQTIGWLVPYAISIAIFPFLCELVDREDNDKLGALLTQSGRMLLSVFVPFAVVCAVLATPVTSFLFEGGKFTSADVHLTSVSMACQILVLPAYALEYLMMQAFFAKRKMLSVTLIGVSFSIISMEISYYGIITLGAQGATALAIVALGFTVTRTAKVAVLIRELKNEVPCFPLAETLVFCAKTIAVAALSAGAALGSCVLFDRYVSASGGKIALLAELALAGGATLAAFVATCTAFRVDEPAEMLRWVLERLARRRRGKQAG